MATFIRDKSGAFFQKGATGTTANIDARTLGGLYGGQVPYENVDRSAIVNEPSQTDPTLTQDAQPDDNSPITKFNLALMDMLKEAQKQTPEKDFAYQRALQRAQIKTGSEILPEELRVLSPAQQETIRSKREDVFQPESDAIAAKIKADDQRLTRFENLLSTAKDFGEEFAKTIAPSKEIVEGYKKMIIAGGSLSAIPTDSNIRNKVISSMTPEEWIQYETNTKKTEASSATQKDYKFAVEGGYKGSFIEYQKDIQTAKTEGRAEGTGMGISDVTKGQIIGASSGLPIKLSNEQSQFFSMGMRLSDITKVIKETINSLGTGAIKGWVTEKGYLVPVVQDNLDPKQQDLMQKMFELNNMFVYFSTGKQINEIEFERLSKQTPQFRATPTYNDSAIKNFSSMINERMNNYLKVNGWKISGQEPTGKRIKVISPQGQKGDIPEEQLQDALNQGYKQI